MGRKRVRTEACLPLLTDLRVKLGLGCASAFHWRTEKQFWTCIQLLCGFVTLVCVGGFIILCWTVRPPRWTAPSPHQPTHTVTYIHTHTTTHTHTHTHTATHTHSVVQTMITQHSIAVSHEHIKTLINGSNKLWLSMENKASGKVVWKCVSECYCKGWKNVKRINGPSKRINGLLDRKTNKNPDNE